jgi:cell division septation protein DedD
MTPVLLDQKSIFKTGISIILVMAVVFVSGYYAGYQKAESGKGVDFNKPMVLALPKPAHAEVAQFEPFIPEAQLPGADIDVDSPDTVADGVDIEYHADAQVNQAETQIAAVIDQTTNAIEAPVRVDNQAGKKEQQLQLASLTTVIDQGRAVEEGQVISNTENIQQSTDSGEPRRAAVISNSASAEDARYTIQVGVFSDEANAMRKKTELESWYLTAYINPYKNKRGQPRFNVRFGYFKDKSSAVAALTRFEQDMSGSGYVTRLRRN